MTFWLYPLGGVDENGQHEWVYFDVMEIGANEDGLNPSVAMPLLVLADPWGDLFGEELAIHVQMGMTCNLLLEMVLRTGELEAGAALELMKRSEVLVPGRVAVIAVNPVEVAGDEGVRMVLLGPSAGSSMH